MKTCVNCSHVCFSDLGFVYTSRLYLSALIDCEIKNAMPEQKPPVSGARKAAATSTRAPLTAVDVDIGPQ